MALSANEGLSQTSSEVPYGEHPHGHDDNLPKHLQTASGTTETLLSKHLEKRSFCSDNIRFIKYKRQLSIIKQL